MKSYDSFLKKFRIVRFKKGEVILQQDEVPPAVYVVQEGVVKTYNITADGNEKPISFEVKNEIFPVAWTFFRAHRTLFYYEALTDVRLFVVPRQDFKTFLNSSASIAYDMFDTYIGRYVGYTLRVHALSQSKAREKLLHTLHFLCLRFGRDISRDNVKIGIPLTQQEIANFMGLSRETTAIELKKLEQQGVITYRQKSYRVLTNKLNELLTDEYNPGLRIK
ncbi:MAG TPA: Crp/Fnr family transcriptional regulator [Patescibacteria group bacterium]|jgi:CRP/FNR family cyclic AMP-dependent transcriptional regulator|nr:Crp/Fnr family transcriptional regulator [Patescibacteria group bacterium]